MSRTVPDSFTCPITAELMADPVSTSDGFSYEREAITEWLRGGQSTSPLTGAPLDHAQLVPNHALRSAIQQYVADQPDLAEQLYRPRDVSAIRATIGARQWAPPQLIAAELLPLGAPPPVPYSGPAVPLGVPIGTPADDGAAAAAAAAPPAAWSDAVGLTTGAAASAAGAGLSEAEVAAAAAYATPRWESGEVRAPDARGAGAPLLRIRCAAGGGGGGAALDVDVLHDDGLGELASRLAARGTAPLAALRLGAADLQAGVSAGGAGFGRLARALHADGGGGACAGLRELALRNIELPAAAARLLAASLAGHPTLASLELWNVELDDDGALAVGALGAPAGDGGGNAALRELNLGRNLLLPQTQQALEQAVDAARVRLRTY